MIEQLQIIHDQESLKLNGKSGVYAFIYLPKNKFYVGSSVRLKSRFRGHFNDIRNRRHHSYKLLMDCKDPKKEDFKFIVLEVVEDKNTILQREQYWLDRLKAVELGYNISTLAEGHIVWTEEDRKRFSIKQKERKYKPSQLCIEKSKLANTGRTLTDEHKEKVGAFFRGRPLSEETKKKLSESKKGRKRTPEHTEKLRQAALGKTPNKTSLETKNKIIEALKNREGRTDRVIAEEFNVGKYVVTKLYKKLMSNCDYIFH